MRFFFFLNWVQLARIWNVAQITYSSTYFCEPNKIITWLDAILKKSMFRYLQRYTGFSFYTWSAIFVLSEGRTCIYCTNPPCKFDVISVYLFKQSAMISEVFAAAEPLSSDRPAAHELIPERHTQAVCSTVQGFVSGSAHQEIQTHLKYFLFPMHVWHSIILYTDKQESLNFDLRPIILLKPKPASLDVGIACKVKQNRLCQAW